jgi:hypothetical protein
MRTKCCVVCSVDWHPAIWHLICVALLYSFLPWFVTARGREGEREILKRPIRKFRYFHIWNRNSLTLPLEYSFFFKANLIVFFWNSSNQNIDSSSVVTQPYKRAAHWNIRASSTFPSEESDDVDRGGKRRRQLKRLYYEFVFLCIFNCEQCHWIC